MGLTLVLGGQKSGKSTTAARLATRRGAPVTVVTPARGDDPELAARIARHRADRPSHWRTLERFDLLACLHEAGPRETVLIDALDTWLVERMTVAGLWDERDVAAPLDEDATRAWDAVLAEVSALTRAASARPGGTILIAGQPGLGPHAMGAAARRYVDLHGLALQRLAQRADETLLVVAGRVTAMGDAEATDPGSRSGTGRDAGAGLAVSGWAGSPAPAVTRPDDPEGELARRLAAVHGHDAAAVALARERVAALATPPGALGGLADAAVRLAGIAGCCPPPVPRRAALVVASGDHGVHAQGVTPWPRELTGLIADLIADGRGGAGVLADEVEARTVVLDVGGSHPPLDHEAVISARVVEGTADLRERDAMTRSEALTAVLLGARTADALIAEGADALVTGDVGIANTTASAALVGAMTGRSAEEVTGPGTGIDDATLARKREVVADALARAAGRDPLGTLAAVGGAEHAALCGVVLAGAAARIPVILDGVIADAAALVAVALAPDAVDGLVAGHRSPEPGAAVALAHLGLDPLVDLGLRLGEGSGALLALPLLRAAARCLRDVATLAELGMGAGASAEASTAGD